MPILLFVVYPCVLWSTWYESVTGNPPSFIKENVSPPQRGSQLVA
jgi:hypothetical protein